MATKSPSQTRSSQQKHHLRKTLRPSNEAENVKEVYILVMGLTGAGKSTFISIVTGDDSIPIGKDDELDCVTQEVRDYSFETSYHGEFYEVHLIDSPGFDDGVANDAEILSRIATYINVLYKMKNTIAGVLYLHDITKARMGGVGLRNLRMLENMIGMDKWDNCTLVTTKWGCTNNAEAEEGRENQLRTRPQFFQAMIESSYSAKMVRFHRSKASGLEIIRPHLRRAFTPKISEQMVDPDGPKYSLGETDAGKVVADNLEKLAQMNQQAEELAAAKKTLEQKFDEKLFQEYKRKRDEILSKHRTQRASRWAVRAAILGGGIAAGVVTMGPGASVLAAEPVFERYARKQKRRETAEKIALRESYKKESAAAGTMAKYNTDWLMDRKVQHRHDLDCDEYSMVNQSESSVGLAPAAPVRKSRDSLSDDSDGSDFADLRSDVPWNKAFAK
ncbi:uncharacterized protein HMPREF1541_07672 [Cyphellophora europaea CBS 101466]|uniref:G domain-containing protein n=1 Tax=Cyphellophora europaea (strain CBS 101466) TaxID=1220924 RepID=W2RQQ5_CYPE1|nr:uncharacterized protein HMPREF1541_07672 [Cyphellophora europaea CBS 101466]ETN38049.1 hypothetical protein HMPREF1541_07672 [Cyphellophora europaea CBS 101466]